MSPAQKVLIVLATVIAFELLLGSLAHRTPPELEMQASEGTPRERAYALHVLSNRGTPRILEMEDLQALLDSEEPLLREFAMTYDFARSEGATLQREIHDTQPEEVHMNFFVRHQKLPMHRTKVSTYFSVPMD